MHSASSAKALLPCGGDLARHLSQPWWRLMKLAAAVSQTEP